MLDPLRIAILLLRITLRAWSLTETDSEVRYGYYCSLGKGLEFRCCLQKDIFGYSSPKSSSTQTTDMLHSIPHDELWRLRDVALFHTRRAVGRIIRQDKNLPSQCSTPFDDEIIQVSLMTATGCFLFGERSTEHRCHTQGLTSLLCHAVSTTALIYRFYKLVSQTYDERLCRHFFRTASEQERKKRPGIDWIGRIVRYSDHHDVSSDKVKDQRTPAAQQLGFGSDRESYYYFIPGVYYHWEPIDPLTMGALKHCTRINAGLSGFESMQIEP